MVKETRTLHLHTLKISERRLKIKEWNMVANKIQNSHFQFVRHTGNAPSSRRRNSFVFNPAA
jgi:hypothetical protein